MNCLPYKVDSYNFLRVLKLPPRTTERLIEPYFFSQREGGGDQQHSPVASGTMDDVNYRQELNDLDLR